MKAKGNDSVEKLQLRRRNIKVCPVKKKGGSKEEEDEDAKHLPCNESGIDCPTKPPTILYVTVRVDRD